ncbi:MAG: redoxin family protein [Pirellula sp.]|nr:redoxin family protein [Pirellula sp.]
MQNKLAVGCLSLVLSSVCGCSQPSDSEKDQVEIPSTEQATASDSVPSLLDANVRASGGIDAWRKLTGIAMEAEQTVSINGQVTVQTREKTELDLSNSRWRVTSFSGDATERFTVGTLSRCTIYKCEENRIVGATDIKPEMPILYPELQMLSATNDWRPETFRWKEKECWSLISKAGDKRRIYDQDSFLLLATIETTPYGSSETMYSDYRSVDQCLFPFHIRTIVPESNYEVVKQFTTITLNPSFEEQSFEFNDDWKNVKEGSQAPEFEITDFRDANKKWTKASVYGKVILIDFWATWCGPCIKEIPELRKICQENQHPDFIVLAVSFDADAEPFTEYINENMPDWNHALIANGFDSDVAKQFEIASIPRTVLIDQKGVIVGVDNGAKGDVLRGKLKTMLADSQSM